MTTLSYTVPVAGSTLNSVADPEVATALTTILTWSGGNIDGTNVAATITGRRLISTDYFFLNGAVAANYFTSQGISFQSGASVANAGPSWWMLDPAGFAVTGKSNTQLVLRMSLATNATAPTVTFNGQLRAVTFAGGGNVIVPTAGAQQGTSASIATPSASSVVVAESAVFTFPAAGAYAPIVNVSGSMAANSAVQAAIQLFALNS